MYDSKNSHTAHKSPKDMFESNRTAWNEAMAYHSRARGQALQKGFEEPDYSIFDRDCDGVLLDKLASIDIAGKYEVTKAQFTAFLNAVGVGENCQYDVQGHGVQTLFSVSPYGWTPVWDADSGKWVSQETHPDDAPMIQVTWYGAKAYADWVGGTLPTEAQWEYACRAGTTTAYSFGDDPALLGDYAWFQDNSWGEGLTNASSSVGLKRPNHWGLYDMHGNAYEWCSDWYDYDYYNDPSAGSDPTGPASGSYQVLRGGSWRNGATVCRSAYRFGDYPVNGFVNYGFRVVSP